MKLSSSLLGALVILSAGNSIATAQSVTVYRYPGTGNVTGHSTPHTITMRDSHYQEIGGTDMAASQVTRWHSMLSQRLAFGQGTSLVRGWDLVEDYDINWSTEALTQANDSRWVGFDSNHTSGGVHFTKTNNVGPHANEYFLYNPYMLAAVDDHGLFWDPEDSTFSLYSFGGGLLADYTWTTLSGGAFGGQTLSEALLKQYFIGAEQNQMALLNGDNAIEFYNFTTGAYLRSANYSAVTTGPLSGDFTLADVIDGKVEGLMYLGIDSSTPGVVVATIPPVVVPEPSTLLLIMAVAGAFPLMLRRRRRQAVA